ncbi:MAG: hypothetical protein JO356_21540 [Acidobacteria bacterium]|nr:hypothetical protein [Acidobacteriota bacterium]
MRPFSLACAILLSSGMAFTQTVTMVRPYPGTYGYGPYVPLVTTPEISLQQGAPAPVGASNATYGLVAGARNATLSIVTGNTSSIYTLPVWYSGGRAPLISSPQVSLQVGELSGGELLDQRRIEASRGERERAEAKSWTYFAPLEETTSAVEASQAVKTARPAAHSYTNQDVQRQNDKNGMVKYDGKSEQIR